MAKEIWFTTTKKGTRQAWTYSTFAGRAIRLPLIDTELDVITGQAIETTKPEWVGK